MKKINKVLALVVVLSVATPSVAFAAWWNPFTWFNNNPATPSTTNEQMAALEQKVSELQNEVNANTSTTSVSVAGGTASSSSSAISPAMTTPIVKKVVTKKVSPVIPSTPATTCPTGYTCTSVNATTSVPSASNSTATVQACIDDVNQTNTAVLLQISNDEQQAYTNYQNDVAELTVGTYPLTAAQQAQVTALNAEDATALYSAQLQDGATSNENNPEGSKIQETIANHNSQAALTNLGNEFAATNYQIVNDQYNAYVAAENEKEANTKALTEAALQSCSNGN
jgi:hypothetical protein